MKVIVHNDPGRRRLRPRAVLSARRGGCAASVGMFRGAANLAAPLLPHWQESGWELPMNEQTSTPHGCFTPFSDMRWHSLRDPSGK